MNIVVTMAGAGSRFKNVGFKKAKPFIDVKGKMMIERVLDGVYHKEASYILIIQKVFLEEYEVELNSLRDKYDINFSCVDRLTKGALCTALSAFDKLNKNEAVIFLDADNIFDNTSFKAFINYSLQSGNDANLLTFQSEDNRFSFAKLGDNNLVSQTAEKVAISTNAIAGAYMFSNGEVFIKSAIETIIYDSEDKSEFYMSKAYNTLIKTGAKVGIYNIKASNFSCIGTPEQLETYLKKNIDI